jgi:hypothetical protein
MLAKMKIALRVVGEVFLEMELHHFKKTREEDKLSLKIGYFLFCTDYFDYLIIAA